MKNEKRAQLCSDISMISALLATGLVIASFFFSQYLWRMIAGVSFLFGVLQYADAVKALTCDGEVSRGRKKIITGVVFSVLAVALLFV